MLYRLSVKEYEKCNDKEYKFYINFPRDTSGSRD